MQLQLKKEQARVNTLKSKYENEKLLRLRTTKIMKSYKKKWYNLSDKFKNIPFLKIFTAQLSNPKKNGLLNAWKLQYK